MAQNRCTMFFQDDKYGWSETFYDALLTNTIEQSKLKLLAMMQFRAALLSGNCTLTYGRVSDDEVFRDSAVLFSPDVLGGSPGADTIPGKKGDITISDNPYSGVLLRVECGTKVRGLRTMSGVADDYILDQALNFPASYKKKLSAYFSVLKGGWGLKNRKFTEFNTRLPIQTIAVDGATGLVKISCIGLIVSPKQQVRVSLARLAPGSRKVNGVWKVAPVGAGEYLLIGSHGPVTYLGGALADPLTYEITQITEVTVEGPSEHRRGRPFNSPHGRRNPRKTV